MRKTERLKELEQALKREKERLNNAMRDEEMSRHEIEDIKEALSSEKGKVK